MYGAYVRNRRAKLVLSVSIYQIDRCGCGDQNYQVGGEIA